MKRFFRFGLIVFSFLLIPRICFATDVWVYVEKFDGLLEDDPLPIKVCKGELFPKSRERAVTEKLTLEVYDSDGDKYLLPLTPETDFWSGKFTVENEGAHLIVAKIDEDYWTRTGTRWLNLPKIKAPISESSFAFWYLSKAILSSKTDDELYRKTLGEPLEIIALDNPALVKPGPDSVIRLKVLFQGKPLSSIPVEATYDGFNKNPEIKVATVRTNRDGIAEIPIPQSGVWYITAEKQTRHPGSKLYEKASYRSNLIFQIRL